jgi:hypothetical protein
MFFFFIVNNYNENKAPFFTIISAVS